MMKRDLARITIIGAGSAGAVLAARLSELSHCRVTVLEAGPDYTPAALPPDLADGNRNSMLRHDWGFKHKPNSLQFTFPLPRGRVSGGSSAVNTCIALRGDPYDYDEWAALGLPQWSYRRVLPAFKKLECDLDFGHDSRFHGSDGPLPLRRARPEELSAWQQAFLEACAIKGFGRIEDTNRPGQAGAGSHAMNKINGRRISAAEAWLTREVRSRPNLNLISGALVHKIIFDGTRATAVDFEQTDGKTGYKTGIKRQQKKKTRLKRLEHDLLIVSAGAISTPALLWRSGVASAERLEKEGLQVTHDLPAVAARLLDHPGCAVILRPRFGAPTSRRDPTIQTALRYGSTGSGFINDMTMQPGSNMALPWFNAPLVSIMAMVGKPAGQGSLSFRGDSPYSRPQIKSALLDHPIDRARAVEAMQLAAELAATPPMRKLAVHLFPRSKTLESSLKTDEWIRRATDSGYHPCGTVPMGADSDPAAAADYLGRLKGLQSIIVADASLMPTVPSSNINLATLMIGEHLAGLLKEEIL